MQFKRELLLKTQLLADFPSARITDNFVGLNLATPNTAIKIKVLNLLFINGAIKFACFNDSVQAVGETLRGGKNGEEVGKRFLGNCSI